MRPVTLALLFLACTPVDRSPVAHLSPPPSRPPPTRTLALPGVTLAVPAAYVALEPERIAELQRSARAGFPDGVITIEGARDPAGLEHGMVYLQRTINPRGAAARPLTVRQALLRLRDEMKLSVPGDQIEVPVCAFELAGDSLTGTITMRMASATVVSEIRSHVHIVFPDPAHVVMHNVTCMADADKMATTCDPILRAHTFAPAPALALDTQLPSNSPTPVPLVGVTATRVAGVVFGATRDEFTAACRNAGLAVNAVDWTLLPEAFPALFTAGTLAQCAGLPTVRGAPPFELGRVHETLAVFVEGKLAIAELALESDLETTAQRLIAAYPDAFGTQTETFFRVDDDATGDQLLHIRLADPIVHPGVHSSLQFITRRGADTPFAI